MRAGGSLLSYTSAWLGVQICVMCVFENCAWLVSVFDFQLDKDLWPNSDCSV